MKKNYVVIQDTFSSEIIGTDKPKLIIEGKNTQGKMQKIRIDLPEYFFPQLALEMIKSLKNQLQYREQKIKSLKQAIQ